jgi:hypothetical protein
MKKILFNTAEWIRDDFRSHPFRFTIEMLSWALSISAAILFSLTVPNVPFFVYLTMTITSCAMYAWSAWNRGSFGMLANYLLITAIDTAALLRLLL